MLRISTTTIELYNRFLCDEDFPEEVFISQLTKKTPPTKFMELGTAFHEILEKPHEAFSRFEKANGQAGDFLASNGIVFPHDVISKCFEYVDYKHPFEIKLTKIYPVLSEFNTSGTEPVEVVAKVDQGKGILVIENKTCWSGFQYDKYANSLQWKFYLDIHEAQKAVYKVFELYDGAQGIVLKNVHVFSFDWYEEIRKELNNILESFINYIYTKNLQEYFNENK